MNDTPNNFKRSSLNGFSASFIDRAHNRRKDDEWLRERLRDPSALFVSVWQSNLLFAGDAAPHPAFLSRDDLARLGVDAGSSIFLGLEGGRPYFAVDVTRSDSKLPPGISQFGEFKDLRAMSPLLDSKDAALLAYAKTITHWHGGNRFCGYCGSPTVAASGGHVLVCSNEECAKEHFPRTDPAIIVLVASGDSCLLARQAIWPKFRYSVVAGFVEPGENVEDAVAREVFEETGIRVREISYHSSQPWPFPCSIMLGYTARAERGRISLRDRELEDAMWFSRSELTEAFEQGKLLLPPKVAIAFHLIEDWFDSEGTIRLKDLHSPLVPPP